MQPRIWLETWRQDFSYALRTLRKSPAFALTAALTLAIGIGGNTAIFSVIRQVLLKPLAYHEPDRLAYFSIENPSRNDTDVSFRPEEFRYLQANVRSFDGIGAYGRPETLTLSGGGGDPELLKAARVSANFLEILGIRPMRGRGFLASEDTPGGPAAAIVSASLFRRRFGSDAAILGKTAILDATPHTIVGVLPEGFEFPYAGVDVWIPRPGEWSLLPPRYWGKIAILTGFGRLRGDSIFAAASAEMALLMKQFVAAHPSPYSILPGYTMKLIPLKDRLVSNVRDMLWMLFGAAGFVLLIACANLAGLLLARAASRSREFAIRSALGAGRWRLIRQLLAECLVIASAGGLAGLLLANWILAAISRSGALQLGGSVNAPYLPGARTLQIDLPVLGFTAAVSICAAAMFGLLPALRASRPCLARVSSATRGFRARDLLVALQIALSIVLLIGAGLLLQSFARIRSVDPGFDTSRLLTAKIALPLVRYDTNEKRDAFFRDLVTRMRNTPGVRAAAIAKMLPTTAWIRTHVEIPGKPPGETAVVQSVTPAYFQTLSIPVKMGRAFTERDNQADAPPVAIVNETLARRLWPGYPQENPVGARMEQGFLNLPALEVAGVVADIREGGLASDPVPEFYLPSAIAPPQTAFVIVKSEGDPMLLGDALRRQVNAVDASQSISDIRTMEAVYEATLGQRRLTLILLGSFGGAAFLLALLGIYGVIAYSMSQRTQEVGVRRALGAQNVDIVRLVLRHGLWLSVTGGLTGLAGALALTRLLQGMLFGVTATDPWTFAVVLLLFAAVALAACLVPAWRASQIDPLRALRSE
jgi:predicted permease